MHLCMLPQILGDDIIGVLTRPILMLLIRDVSLVCRFLVVFPDIVLVLVVSWWIVVSILIPGESCRCLALYDTWKGKFVTWTVPSNTMDYSHHY